MPRSHRGRPARTGRHHSTPASSKGAPHARKRDTIPWLFVIPLAAALAGVALFLQREWTIARLWGFSLDDSWIYAVFARNIATGQGFAFNPGESVSGSTGPLYSLLLALAYRMTGEMVWTAKTMGVLFHLVAVLQMYRAARHVDKRPWFAALTATFVAVSAPLLWASVSGMEISLCLALICTGLERYVAGKDVAATLFWSLGVWVRPDGVFLVGLSMLGPVRTLWKRAAVAVAVILPFFAFNAIIGGSIFPQTVAAKTHLGFDFRGRTWVLLREWGAIWGVPFPAEVRVVGAGLARVGDQLEHPLLFLPFLILGIALTIRRRPILALYAVGLPIAFSLFRENGGSQKRYILYVIPFGILLAAVGIRWLADRIAPRRASAAFLAVSIACLVWQASIAAVKANTHGWNVENINVMQRNLGETANRATTPDAVIAASDIGAIKYFSHRKVVDLMGLVSKPRSLPENLSYYKPDVMIVIPEWFRAYARRDSATHYFAFYDEDSTHKYTPLAVVQLRHNTICAGDQMIAFVRQNPGDAPPPIHFERY